MIVTCSICFDAHFLVLILIMILADGFTILEISNVWRGGGRREEGRKRESGVGFRSDRWRVGDVIC